MMIAAQRSATTIAESLFRKAYRRKLREIAGPPVTFHNSRDRAVPPLTFRFINSSVLASGVFRADPETVTGCKSCRPQMGRGIGCEYTKKCECLEYAEVDVSRLSPEQVVDYERKKLNGESTIGLPKRFPYISSGTKTGCLIPKYLDSRNVVFECNDKCSCGLSCRTRVVQKGRTVPLEIFRTENRGWGKLFQYYRVRLFYCFWYLTSHPRHQVFDAKKT